MFQTLQPLLAKRSIVLTLAALEDGRIRVTVNPMTKTTSSDIKDTVVPFVAEGSAEELDAELAGKLGSYSVEHLSLDESLEQTRNTMEAAKKAAKDEAAAKQSEAKKASAKGKVVAPAKPAADAKAPTPEPVKAPDLFSMSETQVAEAESDAPAPTAAVSEVAEIPQDGADSVETEDITPTEEIDNGSQSEAA